MTVNNTLTILLASPEPALLAAVEPVLLATGARVEIVLTARAALAAMNGPIAPGLALLDTALPDLPMGQLLAEVRAEAGARRFPIVLISDSVSEEWTSRIS